MKRLALLLIFLLSVSIAAPVAAQCGTPTPTATPFVSYADKVLGASSGHLVAYWKLDESTGTTASDSSGNSRNATYSGVTLAATTFVDGGSAPSFDGVNDYINLYTSSFNAAFSRAEGTVQVWFKVAGVGVWTDATGRNLIRIASDNNNFVDIRRISADSTLRLQYDANSVQKIVNYTSSNPTGWVQAVLTWSKSSNQIKAYIAGSQTGGTQTGVDTWTANLSSTQTTAGANTSSGANPWYGSLAHIAIWDTALDASTIADLASVPVLVTPTPAPTVVCSTSTPTPTAELIHYLTVIPPGGTVADAQTAAFINEVSAGQAVVGVLLFALLTLRLMGFILNLRGR